MSTAILEYSNRDMKSIAKPGPDLNLVQLQKDVFFSDGVAPAHYVVLFPFGAVNGFTFETKTLQRGAFFSQKHSVQQTTPT
jgi:hypothetical protein